MNANDGRAYVCCIWIIIPSGLRARQTASPTSCGKSSLHLCFYIFDFYISHFVKGEIKKAGAVQPMPYDMKYFESNNCINRVFATKVIRTNYELFLFIKYILPSFFIAPPDCRNANVQDGPPGQFHEKTASPQRQLQNRRI